MPKDFGSYHLLLFVLVCLSTFFLFSSLELPKKAWNSYNQTIPWWNDGYWMYADWRNVPSVEYASNPQVCQFYKKEPVGLFRNQNFKSITLLLLKGDTVRVAVDYYGLMPGICGIPVQTVQRCGLRLLQGQVIVFELFLSKSNAVAWREVQ